MLVASMVFGMCQAYEHSRQHGKHECLYKSHKQFQKVHKNGKEYLIPCIDEVVISVDIDAEKIIIKALKGIFEDEN